MASLPPNSPPGPPGGPPADTVAMGPPPGGPRRRLARPLVITGVVAVVVGAGAGVAAAVTGASNSPAATAASAANPAASPTPTPGDGDKFPRIRMGPFGGSVIHGLGAPFGAVHGEFVVPKSGGGYQTMDTQRGSVTAVSSSSITVKSGDGFTKTYTVTSDTMVDAKRDGIGSIKVGDQVFVMATVSGSTATAANIADISNFRQLHPKFFGAPPPSSSTG
jgi:hypothetical protein